MRYIGFDMGDGESAVAAFEQGSSIEPIILPLCGVRSLLSAVGMREGEIVIGERAYTDALAEQLSVRFKSRFSHDLSGAEDISRFVRGVLRDLINSGHFSGDDQFIVGCPAGWNAADRARYKELLLKSGVRQPQVISESRAAFLYAKYAHTVALDIDLLNESALVIDVGSSTLDYAYIVEGRETGIGTFGETSLGGGLLDAAILRRAIANNLECEQLESVFAHSRSWYSYCEIEARRLKEEYFSRLAAETAPAVKKQLRICYDGMQKLVLEINNDIADEIITQPLKELNGLSFTDALVSSLENAAAITSERPPKLILLTGGASRMPFLREAVQNVFSKAVVVNCPEPEFSIAKGLAYAGWVDENLRHFRQTIREKFTEEMIAQIAEDALPDLLPSISRCLSDLLIEEAALPLLEQWKHGAILTLKDLENAISDRMKSVLASPMAQEALAPTVSFWLQDVVCKLQSLIDPICDRYQVPRKQMQLQLSALYAATPAVKPADWVGLPAVGTLLGTVVSVITGIICGGGGIALVASGPIGFAAGAVIGVIVSVLGWSALSEWLMNRDFPLLMRKVSADKNLSSERGRQELAKRMSAILSTADSDFQKQFTDNFSRAFSDYIYAIAQAAEIPIE